MRYNQTSDISTLDRTSLKLGSSVSSTEKDIDTRLTKAWTAINRLSSIWKSDLTDKMKRSFFQAAVVSILLYGCTTWTLTKQLEKKLDGNYTRMLRAILNKSWRAHKWCTPMDPRIWPGKSRTTSYMRIRDVALKTCQRRWTIGKSGERGSGICVLVARHDDDDITWLKEFKPWKLNCVIDCIVM